MCTSTGLALGYLVGIAKQSVAVFMYSCLLVPEALGKNIALGLSYSDQFSNRGDDNSGSLDLRVKF